MISNEGQMGFGFDQQPETPCFRCESTKSETFQLCNACISHFSFTAEKNAIDRDRWRAEYETANKRIQKLRALFDQHLATMADINEHGGFQFSQPLINARKAMEEI